MRLAKGFLENLVPQGYCRVTRLNDFAAEGFFEDGVMNGIGSRFDLASKMAEIAEYDFGFAKTVLRSRSMDHPYPLCIFVEVTFRQILRYRPQTLAQSQPNLLWGGSALGTD